MRKWLWLAGLMSVASITFAQRDFYRDYSFSRADTLRGMLRPERTCYDVTFYDLNIRVDVAKRFLSGYVDITYDVLADFETLQIDLFRNMEITRIEHEGRDLTWRREEDAVFVQFPARQKGSSGVFRVYYQGKPTTASNPPWDGGFVWDQDERGRPWVGVACEGDGASLWWPNKDHLSDEPDSMAIRVAVPDGLMCVANGNLREVIPGDGYTRYDWFVSYPINNYNVTVNIADYAHFSDLYVAQDGDTLQLDYYVLPENLQRARDQFKQVPGVLACYERFFDKYPFWEDGYALVETPYLGMEHQSAIAYGNHYMRGYLGGMIPRDMDWDYIIVHETGHEYFGNSISCNDLSEMWIHESFTTYMEALYVECEYSYEDALRYLNGQRWFIGNSEPILGPPDVNWEDWEASDHYYKGAWVLQTLRAAINDDALWFDILKGFYRKHAISNVRTGDFVTYVNEKTGRDYSAVFEQYLWYPTVPVLEYSLQEKKEGLEVRYRWRADVESFTMPVLVGEEENYQLIEPATTWQTTTFPGLSKKTFEVARDRFYIRVEQE